MYLLNPFILQDFKKKLRVDSDLWGCAPSLGPKWPICPKWPNKNILVQTIIITLIYLLALFIEQNLKKILPVDPEPWECTIFGPKMTHFHKWEIFQKTCYIAVFFYSCLSTCQKSKSDINLLVKYWWLKNTEISLAESHLCL